MVPRSPPAKQKSETLTAVGKRLLQLVVHHYSRVRAACEPRMEPSAVDCAASSCMQSLATAVQVRHGSGLQRCEKAVGGISSAISIFRVTACRCPPSVPPAATGSPARKTLTRPLTTWARRTQKKAGVAVAALQRGQVLCDEAGACRARQGSMAANRLRIRDLRRRESGPRWVSAASGSRWRSPLVGAIQPRVRLLKQRWMQHPPNPG